MKTKSGVAKNGTCVFCISEHSRGALEETTFFMDNIQLISMDVPTAEDHECFNTAESGP